MVTFWHGVISSYTVQSVKYHNKTWDYHTYSYMLHTHFTFRVYSDTIKQTDKNIEDSYFYTQSKINTWKNVPGRPIFSIECKFWQQMWSFCSPVLQHLCERKKPHCCFTSTSAKVTANFIVSLMVLSTTLI